MTLNRMVVPALALFLAAAGLAVTKASAAPMPAGYGQDRDDWHVPPGEYDEMQRRGFQDGQEGAQKDYGNNRRPDVNNREEYRDPHIERRFLRAYQEGFRRGYEVAASHLWAGPQAPPVVVAAPPERPNWDRWGMRGLEDDTERSGYREGVEEARKDFSNGRHADPDDHQEFLNPPVPAQLADEYREGFVRGYEVASSQLSGEPAWQNQNQPGQWAPPQRFGEWQRRGFQEGVEGARKDFGNHRRPNVVNREEYREPRIPQEFWHEYRDGFRRGYEMSASQLWGGM